MNDKHFQSQHTEPECYACLVGICSYLNAFLCDRMYFSENRDQNFSWCGDT